MRYVLVLALVCVSAGGVVADELDFAELERQLKSQDAEVRLTAVRALAWTGTKDDQAGPGLRLLKVALRDKDGKVAREAVEGLSNYDIAIFEAPLRSVIRHRVPLVRARALYHLSEELEDAFLPELVEHFEDDDPLVRGMVLRGIRKSSLGVGENYLDLLERALKERGLQREAMEGLCKHAPPARVVELMRPIITDGPRDSVSQNLFRPLLEVDHPGVPDLLILGAQRDDWWSSDGVLSALKGGGMKKYGAKAQEVLLLLLRPDADELGRKQALDWRWEEHCNQALYERLEELFVKDPEEGVRDNAGKRLRALIRHEVFSEQAEAFLSEQAASARQGDVRAAAVRSLDGLEAAFYVARLEDSDQNVRFWAMFQLSRAEGEDQAVAAGAALAALGKDDADLVRRKAVEALVELSAATKVLTGAEAGLRKAVESDVDQRVRGEAAEALKEVFGVEVEVPDAPARERPVASGDSDDTPTPSGGSPSTASAEDWSARLAEAEALASGEHAKDIGRIAKEVQARAARWYSLRTEKKIQCKECKGERSLRCPDCRGRLVVACQVCKGKGTVVTKPGRRPVRRDCSHCGADGAVDCTTCKEGVADCADCVGEGTPGFRPLALRRAFWDFVSRDGRMDHERAEFGQAVVNGRALAEAVHGSIAIERASIERVAVLPDRVIVVAEVTVSGQRENQTQHTTWIRQRGKFYLATEQDEAPEALLE